MGLSFNLRWLVALWSDSGEKCNAGNEKPAAAAACNDCSSAAECSWALRRSSATELERGSVVADVGDSDDDADDVVGGLIGQHEHKPGKAKHMEDQTLIILKIPFPIIENQSTLLMSHNSIARERRQYILIKNISKSYTSGNTFKIHWLLFESKVA